MMNSTWSASPIWSVVGWTMLHFLWVGTILGLFAVIGRLILRSARSEVQYLYSLACLAMLAMTPLFIALALIPERFPSEVAPIQAASRLRDASAYPPNSDSSVFSMPDWAPRLAVMKRANDDSRLHVGRRLMAVLALYLPYLWLVGAPVTFTYLAMGLAGAERLRQQSVLITDPGLAEVVQRLADSLRVSRRVMLAACERLGSPVLVGIVRPTILLPAAAFTGWSPDQLEIALMHELVHVRRWDNAVILLQRLVEAALFFHPVVWVVSGWVHREREHCCDEAVVRHTGRPRAYAEALLALTNAKAEPSPSPATVAMAEGNLVSRVRRLLETEDRSMTLPRITIALTTALFMVPALLIGAQAAFSRVDDPSPKSGANGAPGTGKAEDADRDKSRDEAIRRIAKEAIKAFEQSADKADPTTLSDIARAQAKIGDRAAALDTLRQAARLAAKVKQSVVRNGNTVSYGISSARHLWLAGRLQAELGDKQGALESLHLALQARDEQEFEGSRIETLALIAKELTALKAQEQAREVVKRADRDVEAMRDHVSEQLIIPQLTAVHMAAGDIEGAFNLLDRIRNGPRVDRIKQVVIAHSLGKMAQAAEALDRATAHSLLNQVLRWLDEVPLAEDKALALGDIAQALARIGETERAMQSAREISKGRDALKNGMRSSAAYTMLLIAHEQGKLGDLEGARRTLREAYETAKDLDEIQGKSGRLSEITWRMIVAGDLTGPLRCIEDMEPGHRYVALTRLGIAQRRAGSQEAARATFLRAIEDVESRRRNRPRPGPDAPRPTEKAKMYHIHLDAQINREIAKIEAIMGNFAEARRRADSIPDPALRSSALCDVAHAQAAAGDAQAALDWCRKQELPRTGPNLLMKAIIEGIAEYDEQAKDHRTP